MSTKLAAAWWSIDSLCVAIGPEPKYTLRRIRIGRRHRGGFRLALRRPTRCSDGTIRRRDPDALHSVSNAWDPDTRHGDWPRVHGGSLPHRAPNSGKAADQGVSRHHGRRGGRVDRAVAGSFMGSRGQPCIPALDPRFGCCCPCCRDGGRSGTGHACQSAISAMRHRQAEFPSPPGNPLLFIATIGYYTNICSITRYEMPR